MRSMTLALVVAALLAAPGTLFAGNGSKGDWELGLYGGYAWLDDYGFLHPKDSPLAGARLGYFLTSSWSLEASVQRIFSETELGVLGVSDADVNLDAARLNLLYNFAACNPLRPFLTAGVGYEMIDAENFGESCDFGWNVGGGLRYFLSPHWNLRADGRYVGIKVSDIDESEGNVEATLGLSYLFGGKNCGEEEEPATVIPVEPNQAPSVTCVADRSEILPGEMATISATASDPEGDPITYEWSATSGRVSGTGSTGTFEFTGTTSTTSTVTVRASDNHGNIATCEATVRQGQAAPPEAQAVSCTSTGFPRNLSRLNNVDKACLDDVAQRLSADPRSHVVVIGYADADETSPNTIGTKRADAVGDYLKARGIEASRITTRSAGASQATGNRRVDVWFVPEGATDPK
jgi:outer membrane protein OmpA-like peptidoglycan-associated protein/opacity protein-like surface antigen